MKFFNFFLIFLITSFFPVSLSANESVLTKTSIEKFYSDMIEARIVGGTYLVSFHDKHFRNDMTLIISLIRTSKGHDMPKIFLDHNKESFMEAIERNDKVMNRKSGESNVTNVVISDDSRSAVVDNKITSSFVVQVDPLAKPKNGEEDAQCQDRIVLSDASMIQIVSSKCEVRVSMD